MVGGCIPRSSPPPGTVRLPDEPPPRALSTSPANNFWKSEVTCGGPGFRSGRRILRRFTMPSKNRAPIGPLGILAFMPLEIRLLIYEFVLVSQTPHWTTYGPGSGVETALLRASRVINAEATRFLYGVQHIIVDGEPAEGYKRNMVNAKTLMRMEKVTFCLHYATANRADTEVRILNPDFLYGRAINASLQLRYSTHLRRLHISLLNTSIRKTSGKLQRSPEVLAKMQEFLLPFAYFPILDGGLDVGGYDSIAYTEMFDEMRAKYLRIAMEERHAEKEIQSRNHQATLEVERHGSGRAPKSAHGRCGRGFEEFWGECMQFELERALRHLDNGVSYNGVSRGLE